MLHDDSSHWLQPRWPHRGKKVSKSCVGCKYLFRQDTGYSNYTVLETEIDCIRNRNSNLPQNEPYDWKEDAAEDNWPATNDSRCELYAEGPQVYLDCDGEEKPEDFTTDAEVLAAFAAKDKP